jgi:membrane protein DedA with SNARE-associated domain
MTIDLAQILDLIKQHGELAYGFLFAHALSNSLLALLFAGYAAHVADFNLATLIPVCWAGGFVGDTVRFWLARRWGDQLVGYFPRLKNGAGAITKLIDRHHAWMILIHRYPHGIRGLAAFAYGLSRLPWPRFLVLNFVSAGIWAGTVVMAGYSFGHVSEKALGEAASSVSFAVLVAFLALAWLLSKKLERAIAQG